MILLLGIAGGCAQGELFPIEPDVTNPFADTDTDTDGDPGDDGAGEDPEIDDSALAREAQTLLGENCASCHGAEVGAGGIDYITDLPALVAAGKVVRGDPEASPLYSRLIDETSPMPPPSAGAPLDPEAIAAIREWIEAGAPSPGPEIDCTDNEFISLDDMARDMVSDLLLDVDASDRRFTRYITLTHLYNRGLCDDALDLYRDAAAKLLNSLSREPVPVRPLEIDERGLLLRVDLRDYGWASTSTQGGTLQALGFADTWDAVAFADDNPFALGFEGKLIDDLKTSAETEIPFQPLESLLQVTTRGRLYYDILGLPQTIGELEAEFKVGDPLDLDLQAQAVLRAAFKDSGVSQSNRVIERRRIASGAGAYWRSYDFASEVGKGDVFDHPIDFEDDGGEIIFTLENGLQGYLIIDAFESRIEDAPVAVVQDPLQSDRVVKNAISCMSCHALGIIPKEDQFYGYYTKNKNQFPAAELALIEHLYPKDTGALRGLQDADARRFRDVLEYDLGVATDRVEPIVTVWIDFEQSVNFDQAAAELYVTVDDLKFELAALPSRMRQIRDGGAITRDGFGEIYLEVMCTLHPFGDVRPICPDPQ